LPILTSPTEWT